MGNLISDSYRENPSSDFGFMNGGGIRGEKVYSIGEEFTKKNVFEILPLGNNVLKSKIKGQEIYTVALPNFTANGRDGYVVFKSQERIIGMEKEDSIKKFLWNT